jgi:hypothetical protein
MEDIGEDNVYVLEYLQKLEEENHSIGAGFP